MLFLLLDHTLDSRVVNVHSLASSSCYLVSTGDPSARSKDLVPVLLKLCCICFLIDCLSFTLLFLLLWPNTYLLGFQRASHHSILFHGCPLQWLNSPTLLYLKLSWRSHKFLKPQNYHYTCTLFSTSLFSMSPRLSNWRSESSSLILSCITFTFLISTSSSCNCFFLLLFFYFYLRHCLPGPTIAVSSYAKGLLWSPSLLFP